MEPVTVMRLAEFWGRPATTTLRRVHRLEESGIIRREIRIGGRGGTRSSIYFDGSIEELIFELDCVQRRVPDRRKLPIPKFLRGPMPVWLQPGGGA